MKSKFLIVSSLLVGMCLMMGFIIKSTNQQPWTVPDKYKKMANPVKSSPESIAEGKSLWSKHCASCHGKKGMGDGSKAAQLKTQPSDFTKPDFQNQTDGELFYKTHEGKGDMPNFKKKITDENEIWSLVNYMRTFK